MAVKSKRLRFEVLKRDGFTCQYCGRTPPQIVLHVDHILPTAEGGTDDPENLIAACSDCNLGKAAKLLDAKIPPSPDLAARIEEIVEREQQLRDHACRRREAAARVAGEVEEARRYWFTLWEPVRPLKASEYPYTSILERCVETIGLDAIQEAMDIVASKWTNVDTEVVRYLVGVMRKKEAESLTRGTNDEAFDRSPDDHGRVDKIDERLTGYFLAPEQLDSRTEIDAEIDAWDLLAKEAGC